MRPQVHRWWSSKGHDFVEKKLGPFSEAAAFLAISLEEFEPPQPVCKATAINVIANKEPWLTPLGSTQCRNQPEKSSTMHYFSVEALLSWSVIKRLNSISALKPTKSKHYTWPFYEAYYFGLQFSILEWNPEHFFSNSCPVNVLRMRWALILRVFLHFQVEFGCCPNCWYTKQLCR